MPNAQRIVIVGGPRRGKSTLAERYRSAGIPVFCGDPLSTVKDPIDGVTYLPEGLPFAGDGGGGHYVATHWLAMPGPWVAEGHVMARALRRWLAGSDRDEPPCEQIVVLQDAKVDTTLGQEAMHRNVMTVWAQIADWFAPITHYTDADRLTDVRVAAVSRPGRWCGRSGPD